MEAWSAWSEEAFSRARAEGKPVLLILPSGGPQGPQDWETLLASPPLLAAVERFVAVRVLASQRPDVHARYRTGSEPFLVLSCEGEVLGRFLFGNPGPLAKALLEEAQAYGAASRPFASGTQPEAKPVWTGAVGQGEEGALQSDLPASCLGAVLAERAGLSAVPGALDLLLYAAREWVDQEARARLSLELAELSALRDPKSGAFGAAGGPDLGLNAGLARLYWDAFALVGDASLRETAAGLTDFLLRDLFDPGVGAFRQSAGQGEPSFYAEGNAKAVYALLRASAFQGDGRRLQAATQTLVFLQTQLFDPSLGMVHERRAAGLAGLLGDNAWTALAFSESFLMTGQRQQREFADGLMRLLFQELWDREQGGFVDRTPEAGAIGRLKEPRRPIEENAAAFEALWRLHHLKGNANYRKWLEWGLRGLTAGISHQAAAPLARVQDMMARGRMELELVGRPGEPETDALLVALHRNYLPRKIVSFVDPDDQDYILAHKLQADSYPRLFGCLNFKPKADARDPDQVAVVLEAIMSL
jgi:uncharacterized protein YyaL (SSP411 family)